MGVTAIHRDHVPTVADSLREYGRGFAGGLLFSLPLLYTMEVWWTSFIAHPTRLLVLLGCTFVLLLGYNRYAGMRHDASWIEVAIDSVEELGLGILTSMVMLYLLGRIGPSISAGEALSKIVVEAAVIAIGFSVGSAQLGTDRSDSGKGSDEEDKRPALTRDLVLATCGAVLFAANVAPTEEILIIADETHLLRLLGLAVVSFLVAGGVLYFLDFYGAQDFAEAHHQLDVLFGVTMTYAVALVVSAAFLWFFGGFDGAGVVASTARVIVLGFPAALGASTGRLLLQS